MPLLSPVAFPLFEILDGGRCGCGADSCTRIGKHPAVKWRDIEYGSPVPDPAPEAGFGLKTGAAPKGSGVVVLDVDSLEALEELCAIHDVPDTFTVATPRGAHFYFQHPGFRVKNSAGEIDKGVDVRGDGGFVVGPGSPHKSGGRYEVIDDRDPVPLPAWLLEWLKARPAPEPTQNYTTDVADPDERARRRDLYVEYLNSAPPCVEGQGGDPQLFEVVQRGAYDLALPVDDVLDLVAEHYDPRCDPPWGDELESRVKHKAHDAKTKSTRPRLEPAPAWFLEAPPKPDLPAPAKRSGEIFWDDWDRHIDPPRWLVDTLIPISTVGALVAHGSSLKTWTMLSLAAAVAKGEPWLGRFATRKGRVLVLDYESGEYEIRRRVRLLEGGKVVGLGAWCSPGAHVDDVEFWKRLCEIPDIALLCVDSLAEATTPGVDENTKDAAYPLQLAARYTDATKASVLFVHHSKKDDGGDARKAVRGSTAIFASLDWCYAFEQLEGTTTAQRMRVSCIKPCMGPKPPPIQIELTNDGLDLYEGETALEQDASDGEIQNRIMVVLQGGPVETRAKIAKAIGMKATRVRAEVDALLVRREIAQIKGVGFVLDNDAARRRRIFDALSQSRVYATEAQLATAAHVDTAVVLDLIRAGAITRSAEGRFVRVDQSPSTTDFSRLPLSVDRPSLA